MIPTDEGEETVEVIWDESWVELVECDVDESIDSLIEIRIIKNEIEFRNVLLSFSNKVKV